MNLRLTLLALLVALATPLVAANAGPAAPQAATISIGDVTVTEGDTGATTASFTVTLSESSPDTVTVDYATADGSAAAPGDYTAASGTLTFLPDETTQTVFVDVNGDTLDEDDETFTVELSNPANATIDDGEGIGTIVDNDPAPTVSIGNSTVTEGNSGSVTATFTATLNAPSGRTVTVDYATSDGTATAPDDYLAASGTVTFLPNQTSRPVSVTVNGDTLDEANETYLVTLSNPTNATILDSQGLGTITDDDTPPTVSVDNVTVTEGNSGNVNATFDVSLSTASGQAASVNYATADGTATAPADYAATSGTVNFAAGETTKQVTVLVHGDTLDEANETFTLNLSNPSNVTIADGIGVGTITDDDAQPTLSVNNVTLTEGDSGTTNANFTVSLSTASGLPVDVDYATANGTATAPADYTATGGSLVFTPGQVTKTVTVRVKGDTLDEIDETFTVNLADAVNAVIANGTGVGTITDDRHGDRLDGDPDRERQGSARGLIVRGRLCRAVGGGVVDGDRVAAPTGKRDGEDRIRRPALALRHRDVIDRQGGEAVVVDDRPDPLAIEDRRVRRIREVEEVRLVRLVDHVASDGDVHRLRRLSSRKDDRSGARLVVARRLRGPVGGCVVDGDLAAARRAERDGEVRLHVSAIALDHRHVVHGQRGRAVVVCDRARAQAVADRRVPRVGEVDGVRLVRLVEQVAVDEDRELLRGLAGRERERPARRLVVGGRLRRSVGGRVVHRNRTVARRVQADREGRVRRARIRLGHGDVADRERR